jgi:hypothetical protein
MKDNSETRGSNTGTQRIDQSDQFDSNQMKGSSPLSKDANKAGSSSPRTDDTRNQKGQKGQTSSAATQQPGSFNGEHAHAGSTGTSGGQISPQTHDTANAGRGQGGSGAGSSRGGNQKP